MRYRVTYLDQWAETSKLFANKDEAFAFAAEKGYSKDNDYVQIFEIIPEQTKRIYFP